MRIEINQEDCISAGKCVADHPEGFDFDDDELAMVTAGAQALSDDDKIHAARNCPSRAILLFDDDGHPIEA